MLSKDTCYCANGNKCKQRNKCFRWTGQELMDKEGAYWYADFFTEFKESGKPSCKYFMENSAG